MTKSANATLASSAVLILLAVMMITTTGSASAATSSINMVQSGLVASDSLTTGNTTPWTFGGTANLHNYYEDSQGLHIGVQSPGNGTWINYYATYSHPNAYLYHAVVTIPDTVVPDGVSNIGLYVEGSDFLPHVGCEAYADSTGWYWVVEQSPDAGATYKILYITQPNSTSQTQDCTIITNGSNYLKVYIGGKVVYSNSTMALKMSAPFNVYVQDDSSSSRSIHYGIYRNYYATTDENIKVTNNPSNAATVKVVNLTGQVLASSPVTSGVATLNVGMYNFPLSATIKAYDSNNVVIASGPASIYGGDVYSVSAPVSTAPQPPTGLTATAVSSSQINLSWIAPSDNGGSPITGYKIERSNNTGTTWSTVVSNTASTSTTYSDTGLTPSTTYTYRISAINSVGTSFPSSTASTTTQAPPATTPQPPTGLAATVMSSSQINLSWTASGNGGSAITGYKIERSTDNGATWSTVIANTGTTSTTYSDTGLTPNTIYTYRVSAINSIGTSSPSNTASATTNQQLHSINLVQSGLVVSDPLNNETKTQQQLQSSSGYWRYGGDAIALKAKYDFWKDIQGLHIGVQSPGNGTWAGFYAVSPNTDATLFHSVITTPARTIPSSPSRYYENGIYIQTSQPYINYVTCLSNTNNGTTVWAVASTTGDSIQATKFNVWYVDTSPNQPLTRDCTIITNGDNYLKVYLDGIMVFSNSTMKLQMPKPFNTFLEPQSSYSGQLLNGTYTDYYATSDENIQVTNNPPNAVRVDIVDTSGKVLASAPISGGTAKLDIGKYHFPLAGIIKIYDSSNMIIGSTSTPANIFGGNIYTVS